MDRTCDTCVHHYMDRDWHTGCTWWACAVADRLPHDGSIPCPCWEPCEGSAREADYMRMYERWKSGEGME